MGTTLIEFIVYVSILAVMSSVTVSFLINIIRSYAIIREEKNLTQDTTLSFERIFNEARHATLVYTPTTTSSQLSLRTSLNPPTDETFTYIDYYLDNNVLWEKREGTAAIPITGSNVAVTTFSVSRFYSGSAEGVRIALTLSSSLQNSSLTRTFSWTSSSTLRGY